MAGAALQLAAMFPSCITSSILLYVDGYDLHRVPLAQRKPTPSEISECGPAVPVRNSDHFRRARRSSQAARQQGLEGILAKRRESYYEESAHQNWAQDQN